MSFFIANVTFAADVFWKFVEGQREEYQFFGVGEHHLDSTRTVDALRKATQIGLQSFWTPTKPTGRGGTSGGTAVLCDARKIVTTLDAVPGHACMHPAELPFHDVTPVVACMGDIAIAFVTVYMSDGDGLGGRNAAKYAFWAAMVRQLRIPWILVGDWNVSPHAISTSA